LQDGNRTERDYIQRKAAILFAAGVLAAIEGDVKPDALAFMACRRLRRKEMMRKTLTASAQEPGAGNLSRWRVWQIVPGLGRWLKKISQNEKYGRRLRPFPGNVKLIQESCGRFNVAPLKSS